MIMETIRYIVLVSFVLSGIATTIFLATLVGLAIRNWWRNR